MPFKLGLKKSRHYNVVSKSLFVICVEILDSSNIECTLSSESTGQDCLDNVCQKLGLNQPEFFGLQYINRNYGRPCWLELDRPLKRQLDKHAAGLSLYLRVMFYVISGVRLLNDEVTRYHYFLQLKMDVMEGKIVCSHQQAVELASYCMQAEFGNYNVEKHTSDYLKDFQLFPRNFSDPGLLKSLTDAAIRQHAALHSMPQGTAEEYYITACQRLEGYGQETFAVQDSAGNNIIIGVSLTGISSTNPNGKDYKSYSWADISNVINQKRYFTIEAMIGNSVHFRFPDVDSAKNAWRFCVLQHMFFRKYENSGNLETDKNRAALQPNSNSAQEKTTLRSGENYDDYQDIGQQLEVPSSYSLSQKAQSTSCLDLTASASSTQMPGGNDVDRLRKMLPSYRPAPDYETAVQQKYHEQSTREPMRAAHPLLYSSQPEIRQTESYAAGGGAHLPYPDVTVNNKMELGALQYNTAYSQSYDRNIVDLGESMRLLNVYKQPPPYPSFGINSNSTPDLAISSQCSKPQTHFLNHPVSGSSPDLVSNAAIRHYIKPYGHIVYQPQTVHAQNYLTAAGQHGTYENLASIFDTNTVHRPQAAVIVNDPDITKHIQKMYDEHHNVIYCLPANMKQYIQENPTTTGFVLARNPGALLAHPPPEDNSAASQEPIYENIPLPWQNENATSQMRSRTQSVQSAPEVSVNQSLVNAFVHSQLTTVQQQQPPPPQPPVLVQTNGGQNVMGTSRENLYANIEAQAQAQAQTMAEANLNDAPPDNHSARSSSRYRKNRNSSPTATEFSQADDTLDRNNTFIVNKSVSSVQSSPTGSFRTAAAASTAVHEASMNNSGRSSASVPSVAHDHSAADTSTGTVSSVATSTTSSKTSAKKKRSWGILGVRSKSSEKVKSATLGREKVKEKKPLNNRHRWSTGLPHLQPLPMSISKETMCQLLENKLADSQLFFEFDKIPKKKPNSEFTTALLPENAVFNRFKDVLPYEENRVRLTPTRDNKFGYINASQITATVGNKQWFYIAAQGPTTATMPTFWHCVWEAEVYLLLQLTDLTEDIKYIPDRDEQCANVGQQYQVWWEFTQKTGHCIMNKIRLCHTQSRRYRTVWHLHYTDWGDHGCPNSISHFLGFLEELRSIRQHSVEDIPVGHNKNAPVLVHCTAGVGRTGLAILSDLLLYALDHNQEIDLPKNLNLLRNQRAYMVQTIAQYRFVYSLLIHYLKQTRLI